MTPEIAASLAPEPKKKAKKKAKRHPNLPSTHPANRGRVPKSRAVTIQRQTTPVERSFLQVVAEATLNPACDVGKMNALLDMQERIEDRDAKKAWARDFNAMQSELPTIDKDGKIDHGDGVTARGNAKLKTKFATFPNMMEICRPIMKRHNFSLSSLIEPAADGARINVVSILEHTGGKERTSRFPMTADATGGKNNQQGWGSSQQYGMRYNMIALLQIVTKAKEDVDNDGFDKPKDDGRISFDQLKGLIKLADEAGADKAKFCGVMKVDSMADIPVSRFEEAKTQLNRKLAAKQKKAVTASDFPGDRQ